MATTPTLDQHTEELKRLIPPEERIAIAKKCTEMFLEGRAHKNIDYRIEPCGGVGIYYDDIMLQLFLLYEIFLWKDGERIRASSSKQ
jgi:hypothetical protein